jgi:hypothetical protein
MPVSNPMKKGPQAPPFSLVLAAALMLPSVLIRNQRGTSPLKAAFRKKRV